MLSRKARTRNWILRCNRCGHETGFDKDVAFHRVIAWLKHFGWRVTNVAGAWEHTCRACIEARLDRLVDRERLHA